LHCHTHSFIHNQFAQNLTISSSFIPIFSPFCTIKTTDKTVLTCALLSPIVAIASTHGICDPTGFIFNSNLTLRGLTVKGKIERKVRKVFPFKANNIVLMTLEEPVWELGWCGLEFVE